MMCRTQFLLVSILVIAMATSLVADDTIYLEANFDDKNLDEPIGTGGPTLGEPVLIDPGITVIVRGDPMPTPCLEIQEFKEYGAGHARFEFLGGAELTTGKVGISAMLQFTEVGPGNNFDIYIREQGSSAHSFANVNFIENGSIYTYNHNSPSAFVGTYEANRVYAFGIIFDMDEGTYDIWWDGVRAIQDETHGITGEGIGAVLFGTASDPDVESRFYIDDLLVGNYLPTAEGESVGWGQVKALFR